MINSPCIDICTTDLDSGLCVGCGRTHEEISNWVNFSNKQKETILKALKKRNNIDNNH
jgi:predicted Fe-S protein YdhL (DUF1289 family)